MGQYHAIINITKCTGFKPRALGSGMKLMEFGCDGWAIASLIELLSGPWKGDRVAIVGDYAENTDLPDDVRAAFGVPELCNVIHTSHTDDSNELAIELSPLKVEKEEFKVKGLDGKITTKNFSRPSEVPREIQDDQIAIMNVTRNEVITPEGFGDDPRRSEVLFHGRGGGTLTALAVLLASACKGGPRGGGDIHSESPLVGSWAGDEIAVITPEQVPADATNRDADMRQVLSEAKEAKFTVAKNGEVTRFDPYVSPSNKSAKPTKVGRYDQYFGVEAMKELRAAAAATA